MKPFPHDIENFFKIYKFNKNIDISWPISDKEVDIIFFKILNLFFFELKKITYQEQLIVFSDFKFIYFIFQHVHALIVKQKAKKKGYDFKHLVIGDSYKYYYPDKSQKLFKYDLEIKENVLKNFIKFFYYNSFFKKTKKKYLYYGSFSKVCFDYIKYNNIRIYFFNSKKKIKKKIFLSKSLDNFSYNFISSLNIFFKKKYSISIKKNFLEEKLKFRLNYLNSIFLNCSQNNLIQKYDGLIFSQIMSPVGRVIAAYFKFNKKKSISFDHGTAFHYYHELIDSIFLLNSTHHVCYNKESKKNLQKNIKNSLFQKFISNTKILSLNQSYYKKFFYLRKKKVRKSSVKNILIMGFPMGSLVYPGVHGYNYYKKIQLEIKLAKFLKKKGYNVFYKVHPERSFPTTTIMKNYFDGIIDGKLEFVDLSNYNTIIHTYVLGSSFTYSLFLQNNIILLDQDLKKCVKNFNNFVKKRCYMIKTNLKDNKILFDEKYLEIVLKKISKTKKRKKFESKIFI